MNTLKAARLCVQPRIGIHKAAHALGVGPSTIQRREADDFDPTRLSVADLESMAALYGVSVPALLGREPLPAAPTSAA